MAESAGNDAGIDRRLLRLASEPLRIKALFMLNEHAAGLAEVAEGLGVEKAEAARHLAEMHEAGLIEVVGEVLSGGAVAPRYRATVRLLWTEEELAEMSLAEQRRLSTWIVQTINADVADALESGSFDARIDSHASRTVTMVDEQGWHELRQIHDDALESVFVVQAACAERLAESEESGVPVLSALFCCELPSRATKLPN